MTLWKPTKVRNVVRLGLLVLLLSLVSCRSALMSHFKPDGHVQLTKAKARDIIFNHRFKPASAVISTRDLTLEDCKRLAIKHNLSLQTARIEELTKAAIQASNSKRTLPHLVIGSELSERSTLPFAFSDVLGQEGRPPSLGGAGTDGVTTYSVSRERTTRRYDMEINWSPTDAVLAYYLTRSSRNDKLKAHYQRIRVAQKLIETVEVAFYRLLSLQKSLPLAERLTGIRSKVLNETTHLFKRKLKSIEDYHQAKRNYLNAKRVMLAVQEELEQQRNQLASAMAISPDTCIDGGFRVIGCLAPPTFCETIANMEMESVSNRPENFQAGLNFLNSEHDVKRAIVKLLPRMSGFWKYTYDQNKFLLNKDWDDVGFRLNFDFVEWLSNLDESNAAKSNALKAEQEIGTVSLMVASQVRKVALKYFRAKKESENTNEVLEISDKFFKMAKFRAESDDLSKLELLEAEADNLQAQIESARSLGEAKAAFAKLRAAIGTNYSEPLPSP